MLEMPQLSLIIAKNNMLKTLISFMQFNVMMLAIWLIFFGWMRDQEWLINTLGM